MTIQHLDHLNMTVTDLAKSIAWYGRIFGFEVVEQGLRDDTPWAIIRSGEAMLCLYEHPQRHGPDRFLQDEGQRHVIYHYGFRITDREQWLEKVAAEGLELEFGGEMEWPHSSSWYISDPLVIVLKLCCGRRIALALSRRLSARPESSLWFQHSLVGPCEGSPALC